ncbi:hypothetical protein [Spirillospora sp. CA-294931]|uniref:hypothetical protein n=1 Tax=Spirillospora sp. CA-294931 TaxID=3240042 RepID=UPI003D89D82B
MIKPTRRAAVLALTAAAALTAGGVTASWADDPAPTSATAVNASTPVSPAPNPLKLPASARTTSPGTDTKISRLKGEGRMYFPAPGHDIRIKVDAHAEYDPNGASTPLKSWGTFRIYHAMTDANGTQSNWGEMQVDCLTTGGPTATVTGIMVKAAPGGPWEPYVAKKARMGVSFYVAGKGAGPSRLGLAGLPEGGDLTRCMAPAADAPVIKGGYRLTDRK